MITAKNITKNFGLISALNDVSFEIEAGEIIGFLGPNGAGKTTLMRMLTGYLTPTKGNILIAGYDIKKHSLEVRKRIGYLPETPPLYMNMNVEDYLSFAAKLRGIETRQIKKKVEETLKECHIFDVKKRIIGKLSKGYKQRVGIAQATIHNPDILILDEPTTGLDPHQILQVRELIKSFESKRTVILSTHILSEIEQIAKRVLIIKKGSIVADEKLETLLKIPGTDVRCNLEEVFLKLTEETVEEQRLL